MTIAPRSKTHAASAGFTLAELLIAMSILALVMVFMVQVLNAVSRTWADGERRVENHQNGRAILDLIGRELAPAAISNAHQFIQNPFSTSQRMTTVPTMAPNSDSIFWQAPTGSGNEFAEVGYYLTRDPSAGTVSYQLKRFFVPPGHAKFLIYTRTATADYTPNTTEARWIASSTGTTFTASEFDSVSSVVSDGVLGFWVRCLDVNGEPIPWFGTRSPEASFAPETKFNSAARFQTAIPGGSGSSSSSQWPYTSQVAPAATAPAHRLPFSVELSIITLDSRSLERSPTIPGLPVIAGPENVPGAISTYMSSLVTNRVNSARLFTTRVRLNSGTQ